MCFLIDMDAIDHIIFALVKNYPVVFVKVRLLTFSYEYKNIRVGRILLFDRTGILIVLLQGCGLLTALLELICNTAHENPGVYKYCLTVISPITTASHCLQVASVDEGIRRM